MQIVKFKSTLDFYMKEMIGIKNNTVRFFDNDERFEILKKYSEFPDSNLFIEIICSGTSSIADSDSFTRKVQDVSIYENIYIITWEV